MNSLYNLVSTIKYLSGIVPYAVPFYNISKLDRDMQALRTRHFGNDNSAFQPTELYKKELSIIKSQFYTGLGVQFVSGYIATHIAYFLICKILFLAPLLIIAGVGLSIGWSHIANHPQAKAFINKFSPTPG